MMLTPIRETILIFIEKNRLRARGYNTPLENTQWKNERLQKILSRASFGSRRPCEELTAKGRVTVNSQIATLGMIADPQTDKITVNERPIQLDEGLVYIAVNKPRTVISAASPQDNRKTVRDLADVPDHIYPIGRLDVDSEGLILLTNDGELTNRLTHP